MSFEKEYYESPEFWADGMITDNSNRIRVNETIDMIPADVHSLLDVGCGYGVFPNSLSKIRAAIKVTATDRSREALKCVHTEKFESDISNIPVESGSFDCVTCLQVIEFATGEATVVIVAGDTEIDVAICCGVGMAFLDEALNEFDDERHGLADLRVGCGGQDVQTLEVGCVVCDVTR